MILMDQHSHLKRWGAAYLLLGLFLASWAAQFVAMLVEIGNESRQHGQPFEMDEFWPRFLGASFENWQSEWLQLLVQAVVLLGMKHVLFKADASDMEQVQLDLTQIKEHLRIPPRDDATRSELGSPRGPGRATSTGLSCVESDLIGSCSSRPTRSLIEDSRDGLIARSLVVVTEAAVAMSGAGVLAA